MVRRKAQRRHRRSTPHRRRPRQLIRIGIVKKIAFLPESQSCVTTTTLSEKRCSGLRLFFPTCLNSDKSAEEALNAQNFGGPAGKKMGCWAELTNRSWGPPTGHACGSTFHQPLTGSLWPV